MITNKLKRNELIIKKCCYGFGQHEIEEFLYIVEKTNLDPLMNQIYAMKLGGRLSIQTSIDGLRLLAERSGNYAPGEDVEYQYDDSGNIIFAKAYVKKRTEDGTWHTISSRAYWKEYVKEGNGGKFWKQLPHLMIAKCAEALALRKAFPQDLSGLYIKEEMDQASDDNEKYINEKEIQEIKDILGPILKDKESYILKMLKVTDFSKIEKEKYEKIVSFLTSYVQKQEKTNES